jgi:hypothetical protein
MELRGKFAFDFGKMSGTVFKNKLRKMLHLLD